MSDSDEKWVKARDAAAEKSADRLNATLETADAHVRSFKRGADFGRKYGQAEILSSPDMRELFDENAELRRQLDAIKAGSPKPRNGDWE